MDNFDKNWLSNTDNIEYLRQNWQSSLIFYFVAIGDHRIRNGQQGHSAMQRAVLILFSFMVATTDLKTRSG